MIWTHSFPCFSICINGRLINVTIRHVVALTIHKNFQTNWSMKYLWWFIAAKQGMQLMYKRNASLLLNSLILNFLSLLHWKVQKRQYKDLHFPSWVLAHLVKYPCNHFQIHHYWKYIRHLSIQKYLKIYEPFASLVFFVWRSQLHTSTK